MQRGSWANLAKDSDVWTKMGLGGICLLLILPSPLAFGSVYEDLSAELGRIKRKEDPEVFLGFESPGTQFGNGLAVLFIFFLSAMLFCIPTIVVLMSSAQSYAWLVSEHGTNWMSFFLTGAFGLIALALQFLVALIFPVALAQFVRGTPIKQAMHPITAILQVTEMGAPYWNKAAGFWLFMAGSIFLSFAPLGFWINLVVHGALCVLGFCSLVVSSRYVLAQLTSRL